LIHEANYQNVSKPSIARRFCFCQVTSMTAIRYRVAPEAIRRFDVASPRAERLARATFRLATYRLPEADSLTNYAPTLHIATVPVEEAGKTAFAVRAAWLPVTLEDDTVRRRSRFSATYTVQGGDLSQWGDVQLVGVSAASAALYPYHYGDETRNPLPTEAQLSPYFVLGGLTDALLAIQEKLPGLTESLSVPKF
jgi:hypothetical protein